MPDSETKPPFVERRPGSDFGGNRIFNAPGVVLLIAALTVAIFFFMVLTPQRAARIIEFAAAVSPQRFLRGPDANGGVLGMLSPLIAHMFVHASIAHVAVNSLFLLAIGSPVARRLGADNATKSFNAFAAASLFATFYILSGVAGALLYIAMHTDQNVLLVGASGGVSGLLGALVRFAFNRSTLFGPEHARISPLLSASVLTWSAVITAMNLGTAFFSGPIAGGVNIAWEAHIGGYFFGLLAFPFFDRASRGMQ